MQTDQRNILAFLGTDADFRTWGSAITAQILAMGLVKHTDTGQINWGTVTRPAINVYAGYEIWRFADALQATKPVFIKVEYGIGAVADRPALAITVGTATNGAGTLTGQVSTRKTQLAAASKTAGVVLPSFCSGDTDRLTLCTNLDNATATFGIFINIERPKDSSGVSVGDGIVTCFNASNGSAWQNVPMAGTIPTQQVSGGHQFFNFQTQNGQNPNLGGDVSLSPHFTCFGAIRYGSCLGYRHLDIGELVSITVNHLGANRVFLPLGDGLQPISETGGGNLAMAMPWV